MNPRTRVDGRIFATSCFHIERREDSMIENKNTFETVCPHPLCIYIRTFLACYGIRQGSFLLSLPIIDRSALSPASLSKSLRIRSSSVNNGSLFVGSLVGKSVAFVLPGTLLVVVSSTGAL
uniref:Uncharacterized protein n=1 Tax=Lotharella globosa TaxID=91324 RepID=A0A7S3YE45_9EUKA